MKAKSWTWSDVVKGLKIEDELEITNSDKSWNGSEKPIRPNNPIRKSRIT